MAAGCGRDKESLRSVLRPSAAQIDGTRIDRHHAPAPFGRTPGASSARHSCAQQSPETALARRPASLARAEADRAEREQAVGNLRRKLGAEPALLEVGRCLPHDCSRRRRGYALSGSHASGAAGNRGRRQSAETVSHAGDAASRQGLACARRRAGDVRRRRCHDFGGRPARRARRMARHRTPATGRRLSWARARAFPSRAASPSASTSPCWSSCPST